MGVTVNMIFIQNIVFTFTFFCGIMIMGEEAKEKVAISVSAKPTHFSKSEVIKMKIRKIVSIVMALVLILSILPIGSLTSNAAWPKAGSETLSKTAKGGYGVCQIDFKLVNASSVSGDTATYYMDLYSMKTFKEMGNIYSATFTMNGCALSSNITVSKYNVTNSYYNKDNILSTENKLFVDSASGGLVGDAPALGETVEIQITASMTDTFKFNGYYLSDSCSVTATIKIVVVDSSLLRARIGTGKLMQSSCWTSSTWSSYSDILSEAETMVDGKAVSQSEINSMVSRLDNARNALVHNGSITECEYCKNEKTGMTTTPISYRDVVYGTDKTRQCMDLFLPNNVSGDVSLILYLHGGGWIYGDKSEYTGTAYDDCKKYGVATLTISYRYTSPSVNAFDIADDIAAALAKAKELGAKHGLNIKQMMTYGGSAGGHLALFYAYSRQNTSPIRPVAAFSECGPTNLTNKEYLDSNLGTNTIVYELSCMCGKTFTASTMDSAYNELAAVSPVKYVNADTVPTVICHGMKDITVPFSDAETLDKFLTYYGVPHYFLAYPNTNHAIHIGPDQEYVEYAKKLFDQYVENYLKNINPAQVHDYETKTVPATSTSAGYTMYTCKICGEYHVSDISTVSHKAGAAVRENEIAATCTTEGSYDEVVYCTECGAEMSRTHKTTSKASHTAGDWEVLTPATCDAEGLMVRRCTVCGEVIEQEVVSMLPHTEVIDAAVVATCTEKGKTQGKHCSVCNTVIEPQKETDALGHDMVVIKEGYAATCTEKGLSDEKKCSRCDVVEEQTEIPATGHTIVTEYGREATCTEDGLSDRVFCQVCGYVEKEQEVIESFGGHKDLDNDGFCDRCGTEVEKPQTGNTCDHLCHKDGIVGWLWKNILCPIIKFLGIEQKCKCGVDHWTK